MTDILTDAIFDKALNENKLVFVDFYAEWCRPCKAMLPTIEAIAKEFEGKVKVCKLNIDENVTSTEKWQVYSVPTFILFKNGQECHRLIGYTSKQEITELFINEM